MTKTNAIIIVTNRKTGNEVLRASIRVGLDQAPWHEQLGFPARWGGMQDNYAYSWCGTFIAKVAS